MKEILIMIFIPNLQSHLFKIVDLSLETNFSVKFIQFVDLPAHSVLFSPFYNKVFIIFLIPSMYA